MQKNKLIPLSLLSLIVLSSTSCSIFKTRKPASDRDTILAEIYNEIANANNVILGDSKVCHTTYNGIYQKLFNIAGSSTYFEVTDLKALDNDIQSSFETRIALKDSFKGFNIFTNEDQTCLNSAQDVFKALRYVEDYLIEAHMKKIENPPADFTTLKGEFPFLLVNPKYADDFKSYEDLKSGDVILSRGNAYSSAAIARIAQNDYQFSHLSFVYRDADSHELFTSEAHIEIGSVTAPFSAHLDEKNARSVVFRYKDADIAHLASKSMFEMVKKHQDTGKNIEYDFTMNYKDDSKLFCSEIISTGFKLALPDQEYIPKFKSKFTKGMIPFLSNIGVPVNNSNVDTLQVFAPGDVQFDPNFDLIAEFRNPKKLEESRYKDFILTKMFERMDNAGYKIDPSFAMTAETKAFWLMRRTPIVKKFLEKKFSITMNTTQMQVFMALDKIGDAFYKDLENRALSFDHPMTPKEIYVAIDDFIAKDLEAYKTYKKDHGEAKPAFHLLFHP